jgi:hypothetical protein
MAGVALISAWEPEREVVVKKRPVLSQRREVFKKIGVLESQP